MQRDRYTYRVRWSAEDGEYLGLSAEFPLLSWLSETQEDALAGIKRAVADAVAEMKANGEVIPQARVEAIQR